MNYLQKHFSASLIALAALFSTAGAQAAPPDMGDAAGFSVLGATVTCTSSVIAGDVGISPATAFTNTGCTIAGGMPPATNMAAIGARADFLDAYAAIKSDTVTPCTGTLLSTITGPVTLAPGVYCTDAALTGAGELTLDLTANGGGDGSGVWIFKIGAALTGTNFSVVMANGGQPCNVFWAPSAGVTMTTSALKGNILAGGTTGEITMTAGTNTLVGRALANVAVTMTNANVIGCDVLPGPGGQPPGSSSCKDKDYDRHHHGHDHEDDKHHGHDRDGHDDDGKGHGSYLDNPYDKHDSKSGKSGKK
ncbi:MAG: ice-binding family protein [Gallionella sp.]|nr:ice-binding family protein [Gallionella sp.]